MPADNILDLIQAFRRSKILFTAVQLGIFDKLASGGPQPVEDLARSLQLNSAACRRFLDGCVSLQLLHHEEGLYRNTADATQYLVLDSPDTLANYVVYSDRSLYQLWGHLDDAVREGTNRWEQVFGSRTGLFDHHFSDEAATGAFLGGMHGFGQLSSSIVIKSFDLNRFHHLVDLGGATGHLSIAACEAYPDLRASVMDLPAVEPFARRVIESSRVSGRIEFVAGDFFTDELMSGDLYYLGRILHDWSDDKTVPLLSKIYRSLPETGALLIGETLLNDDRSGPLSSVLQDLNMLVCTDGHERTRAEYHTLLSSAGFASVSFQETGTLVDAILALK